MSRTTIPKTIIGPGLALVLIAATFNDATAIAKMGVVSGSITGGSGYTAATIAFSAPPTGGTQATGTVGISSGAVNAVTITNPGSGYLTPPTATISGDGTGGAYASVKLKVVSYSITNAGSGYLTTPAVTVTGNATSTATLTGDALTGLSVTGTNNNYTAPPTVTIAPPATFYITAPFKTVFDAIANIVGTRASDEVVTLTGPTRSDGLLVPGTNSDLLTFTRTAATPTAALKFNITIFGR